MAYQLKDFAGLETSVAMTAEVDAVLAKHLHKELQQEDLTFAYWRPSMGAIRFTVVVTALVLPERGDRVLHGNVSFSPQYLHRVLSTVPEGSGIAFLHGHPSPGWQGMSADDVVAERDRLAGAVAGRTGLPLVGLTRGTDRSWSGRLWLRKTRRAYERRWVRSVRVVGSKLGITYHPHESEADVEGSQVATASVWGDAAQKQLVRTRVGIVGLGSVGSLVAAGLNRIGMTDLTFIDFDRLELRNLDRTAGATKWDVGLHKVQVAGREASLNSTARQPTVRTVPHSVLRREGLAAALDCDVLVCCVDRPWPRHLLNALAYSHLIPVVDGGIFAKVKPDGTPQHVSWRIHTVGPGSACMVCLGNLRRSDVALDREGKLDDPDYIAGLSPEETTAISRRNVFPFSMSVAAHEILQLAGLITGFQRIGGCGPQRYDAYPGTMKVEMGTMCERDCEFMELEATAVDLGSNLKDDGFGAKPIG